MYFNFPKYSSKTFLSKVASRLAISLFKVEDSVPYVANGPVSGSLFLIVVQLHWDSIRYYKHLHLKKLEILRKIIYNLKYDKNGLPHFCFSGQVVIVILKCGISDVLVEKI